MASHDTIKELLVWMFGCPKNMGSGVAEVARLSAIRTGVRLVCSTRLKPEIPPEGGTTNTSH